MAENEQTQGRRRARADREQARTQERQGEAALTGQQGEAAPGPGSPDEPDLKGEALEERARELEIEGRSDMNADEKRDAIARAEAEQRERGLGPAAQDAPSEGLRKSRLIARSNELLGVQPHVARGVLAEADDPITVDAARERIDKYLSNPVVTEEG